ncbi:hypothetical protein ISN45_Aa08g014020 [Arabidopsis thaliana x Arabidopsis arenosa]|uniref:Uncharacterized protein n=1 Tax=Arabidopsis thaliana x Arabidopsis arenosa TaxID=1240361 RepID=A0A8T1XMI0_9BRAS|nr:hypothetical protein ISN45_Aa08g014020 [Arabidopsis thaliana x Arabidopsis arenosa]
MILKTICLVIAFKSFIVFLSSRESFILITIRQVSRSCVGAFPLLICPGGIGIVSHHLRRVIISDEISPKFRNEFHSQIWDPGISNFGSEDRNIKVRSNFIDKPCFLFSTTAVTVLFLTILKGWKQYGHDDTLSPAIVLGFRSIAVRIPSDDDGDVCKSRAVTFSSLAMIHCFSQIQVNIIYLFCLWYKHTET